MSKCICQYCKGTGKVFDHEDGIFSLGIAYIFQALDPKKLKKDCPVCNGSGKV